MCIVQSGNYLNILDGEGWTEIFERGIAIWGGQAADPKEMAKFLRKVLDNDIKLELNTPRQLRQLISV